MLSGFYFFFGNGKRRRKKILLNMGDVLFTRKSPLIGE